jgi:hypothetical protein
MESRPFLTRIPDQSLILEGSGSGAADHVRATRDGAAGAQDATYLTTRKPVTLDTSVIPSTTLTLWWFEPRTGKATRFGESQANQKRLTATPPESGPDWVLVSMTHAGAILRRERSEVLLQGAFQAAS